MGISTIVKSTRSSGYSLRDWNTLTAPIHPNMGNVCVTEYDTFRPTSLTALLTDTSGEATATSLFTTGRAVHPAWHIAWEPSDVPMLSPKPPVFVSQCPRSHPFSSHRLHRFFEESYRRLFPVNLSSRHQAALQTQNPTAFIATLAEHLLL